MNSSSSFGLIILIALFAHLNVTISVAQKIPSKNEVNDNPGLEPVKSSSKVYNTNADYIKMAIGNCNKTTIVRYYVETDGSKESKQVKVEKGKSAEVMICKPDSKKIKVTYLSDNNSASVRLSDLSSCRRIDVKDK